MLRYTLLVLVFCSVNSSSQAQTPALFKNLYGSVAGQRLGRRVVSAGDVNGDGFLDIAESSTNIINGAQTTGQVSIFTGPHFNLHRVLTPDQNALLFGAALCNIGDFNNDGCDDLLVCEPGSFFPGFEGEAYIFSGSTGSILANITSNEVGDFFGTFCACLGDVNNDGKRDFFIGAPRSNVGGVNSGRGIIYDGADASILYDIAGPAAPSFFGTAACGIDFDGDGFGDFAIASPRESISGTTASGVSRIYSGLNGQVLQTISGSALDLIFGAQLDSLGDVNGDGIPDLAVASHPAIPFLSRDSGEAGVYSGADGTEIWSVSDTTSMPFQVDGIHSIINAGDVNGDGLNDVLIGSRSPLVDGRALICDGATGAVLQTINAVIRPDSSVNGLRGPIANAGDLNGDGFDDLLIADPDGSTGLRGTVRVIFTNTDPASPYGLGSGMALTWTPGLATGSLSSSGLPTSGDLRCFGATPGAIGLAAASLAPTSISVFGVPVLISFESEHLLAQGTLGASLTGEFSVSGAQTQNPFLAGSAAFVQFFEVSPTVRSSNGMRVAFVP